MGDAPALPPDLVRNWRAQREPFAHAISLGTSCYPAWLLAALGHRTAAYPFDWLFAHPEMVLAMLEDRFAAFLDPAEHDPVPVGARPDRSSGFCHHRGYRERFGVEHVFNHHDPTDPAGRAYFERAVHRFHRTTGGDDKTLLLMIQAGPPPSAPLFERLCGAIDRLGPRNTFVCIGVCRTGDALDMGFGEPHRIGRHRMRMFRSTSDIDGVRFGNPIDDLVLRAAVQQFRFASAPLDGGRQAHPTRTRT